MEGKLLASVVFVTRGHYQRLFQAFPNLIPGESARKLGCNLVGFPLVRCRRRNNL